ncbi:MAG: hypothetical protein UW70_C0021G0001, partial [Candidatus Peregrinibacteria bacterium GW2011_GWA2_44_7]
MENREFVIEGVKGAGKTTIMGLVKNQLIEAGYGPILRCAPFAEALKTYFEKTGRQDIVKLWSGTPEEQSYVEQLILGPIEKARERLEAMDNKSVLLFDRGWLTVLAAAQEATAKDPVSQEAFLKRWTTIIPPTFFIKVPPEITFQRRGGLFYGDVGGEETTRRATVIQDYDIREKLCRQFE